MGNRAVIIGMVLLALSGCKHIRDVRTTPGKLQNVPDTYEAQWMAARSRAIAAERATKPVMRQEAAENGIVYARRARELKPDGVEGHYYYALNVGWLADADRSYGLNAVGEMETALKQAGELDEKFDFAGPLRVLGILHLRTPAPPVSIGSPRKGLRLLQRATEFFPDYPENFLYLAEALRDNDRKVEAKEALMKVINAAPMTNRQDECGRWKIEAEKLLQSLSKP